MSLRALALVVALVLIVPAAVAIWRLEWVAARAGGEEPGGRARGLELAYAAVPVALLAALIAFAIAAD